MERVNMSEKQESQRVSSRSDKGGSRMTKDPKKIRRRSKERMTNHKRERVRTE